MSELTLSEDTQRLVHTIQRYLPHSPAPALGLLPQVSCTDTRQRLASLIASSWSRTDINQAWSAVSISRLPAADKQLLFNELWN
jgi:hypothetical protein